MIRGALKSIHKELNLRGVFLTEDQKREVTDKVEAFTNSLEMDKKKKFDELLNQIVSEQSEESKYLYLHGMTDGIRIARWFMKQ